MKAWGITPDGVEIRLEGGAAAVIPLRELHLMAVALWVRGTFPERLSERLVP
jgi:hypothetical protein